MINYTDAIENCPVSVSAIKSSIMINSSGGVTTVIYQDSGEVYVDVLYPIKGEEVTMRYRLGDTDGVLVKSERLAK